MITLISYLTLIKPTNATLPFIAIQPALIDENGKELKGNQVDGRLCIKFSLLVDYQKLEAEKL